jgi:AcrR family transcriptional regulator
MPHRPCEAASPADLSAAASGGVRAAQSERRRSDILKASRDVLAQGYADFSLRKVAAAAGVRLNTVQHHFGDLESLILATVESMVGDLLSRFRRLGEGQHASPADDLLVLLDEAWMAIRDIHVRTFYFEVWAMARHRPAIAELVQQRYADYRGFVAAIARRLNPGLTDTEASTLATLISSWTEGAMVMAHWGGPGMPSLSLVGLRMKAACLALLRTPGVQPTASLKLRAK